MAIPTPLHTFTLFLCVLLVFAGLTFADTTLPYAITQGTKSTPFSGSFSCNGAPCRDGDTIAVNGSEFVSFVDISSIDFIFTGVDEDSKPFVHKQTLKMGDQQNKGMLTIEGMEFTIPKGDGSLQFHGVIHHAEPVVQTKKKSKEKFVTDADITFTYTPTAGDATTVTIPYTIVPGNGGVSNVALSRFDGSDANVFNLDSIYFTNTNGRLDQAIVIRAHSGRFTAADGHVIHLQSGTSIDDAVFIPSQESFHTMLLPLPQSPSFKLIEGSFAFTGIQYISEQVLATDSDSHVIDETASLFQISFANVDGDKMFSSLTALPSVDVAPFRLRFYSFIKPLDLRTFASHSLALTFNSEIRSSFLYFRFNPNEALPPKLPDGRYTADYQILVNENDVVEHRRVRLTSEHRIEMIPLDIIPETYLGQEITITFEIILNAVGGGKSVYTTEFGLSYDYTEEFDDDLWVGKTMKYNVITCMATHKPILPMQYPLKFTIDHVKEEDTSSPLQFEIVIDHILDTLQSPVIHTVSRDYLFIFDENVDCTVNGSKVEAELSNGFVKDDIAYSDTLQLKTLIPKGKSFTLKCNTPLLGLFNEDRAEEDQVLVFSAISTDKQKDSDETFQQFISTRTWNINKRYHDGLNPNPHTTLLAAAIVITFSIALLAFSVLYYRQYQRSKARELEYQQRDALLADADAEDSLNTV